MALPDQNHACASQAMALPRPESRMRLAGDGPSKTRIARAPRRRWPFQIESRVILVWQGPPKVPKVTQSRSLRARSTERGVTPRRLPPRPSRTLITAVAAGVSANVRAARRGRKAMALPDQNHACASRARSAAFCS